MLQTPITIASLTSKVIASDGGRGVRVVLSYHAMSQDRPSVNRHARLKALPYSHLKKTNTRTTTLHVLKQKPEYLRKQ